MVQQVKSINTKWDVVEKATSFLGMSDYGKVLVGNKGFEFFNESNLRDFVQIPWNEIDVVVVSVMFGGKWIPRYAIRTKKNGVYSFSSRDPKKVLRGIRKYIGPQKIVKSLTFMQVVKRGIYGIFHHSSNNKNNKQKK